jgi:general secretion pathway protein G
MNTLIHILTIIVFSLLLIPPLSICVWHYPRDPDRRRLILAGIEIENFHIALERYARDCGHYPSSSEGLDELRQSATCSKWHGPYLRHFSLEDPWRRPYKYAFTPDMQRPVVLSLGADGLPGGQNFAADISSENPRPGIPRTSREFWMLILFCIFYAAYAFILIGSLYALWKTLRAP